jgi:hypothetical protein
MDSVSTHRLAIERVLTEYTKIPYAHGELRCEAIFDREHDRYALVPSAGMPASAYILRSFTSIS